MGNTLSQPNRLDDVLKQWWSRPHVRQWLLVYIFGLGFSFCAPWIAGFFHKALTPTGTLWTIAERGDLAVASSTALISAIGMFVKERMVTLRGQSWLPICAAILLILSVIMLVVSRLPLEGQNSLAMNIVGWLTLIATVCIVSSAQAIDETIPAINEEDYTRNHDTTADNAGRDMESLVQP